MKKVIIILYGAAAILLLGGCRGQLYSGHRDMEHLRPVQTIGLDADGEGVTLSISSGIGPDGAPPLVMKADGSGIEAAAERLQDWSPEDELFYAHVRYILLGESMTGSGIGDVLDWVERSPAMRMDTPLILVKGRADDAVIGAMGEDTDVTERLASLQRYRETQGGSIPTLRRTASSLLERGWALCLAAELFPDEGTTFTESKNSVAIVPAGMALLRTHSGETTGIEWLTQSESLGAELLTGCVTGTHVPACGGTLELIRGGGSASGLWSGDGTLTGIYISCDLLAGVLERGESGTGGSGDKELAAALERAAEGWLRETVRRAQALGCDYLGLEDAVRKNAPGRAADALRWESVFPTLPVTVAVNAQIGRSYDLS